MTTLLAVVGFAVAFVALSWLLDVRVSRDGLRFREWWSQCPLWHDPQQ
jgi:hypothetical protein